MCADSATLYFDLASDTAYLSAANVHLPNAVTVHVGPDGKQVTTTPTPQAPRQWHRACGFPAVARLAAALPSLPDLDDLK